MIQEKDYRKLYETNKLVVGHIFETAYITNKNTGESTFIGDFIGDPSCGFISSDDKWCLIGGSTLILWTEEKITEINDKNLHWACKIRQTDINTVEILVDQWKNNSSIWELNIKTAERRKIKDFDNYKNQKYTDNIDW